MIGVVSPAPAPIIIPQENLGPQKADEGGYQTGVEQRPPEASWDHWWDDPLIVFTLVLAIATVLIGGATLALWSSTRKLWQAGERQLTHSEDTAKRQLRAYMGIFEYELIPYQLGVVGTGKFRISMKNFGQTPAIALTTKVSYAIRPWVDKDTHPTDWDVEAPGFPIDIAPGAPMFREIFFSEHAIPNLEELQSGDSGLWMQICAVYEDIFKRRHEQTTLFYSRRTSYQTGKMLPTRQTRETTGQLD